MQNLNTRRASTPKKKGVTIDSYILDTTTTMIATIKKGVMIDSRIVNTTTTMIATIAIVATVAAIMDA
jgi:hypothetical protein